MNSDSKANSVCITDKYGRKVWINKEGQYHRVDGPAIEGSEDTGRKDWYVNGKRHRLDGPAIEGMTPANFEVWYINGERLTCEEFNSHPSSVCAVDNYILLKENHVVPFVHEPDDTRRIDMDFEDF